ncbi:MAG: hypothetical protein JSW08_02500 [archaeon]|nr:MAG: hypothetical protein JSW08_02500 [archaeon]
MKLQEKEIEVECPKCKTKEKVMASNRDNKILFCKKCGQIIVVEKIKI